MSQDKKPEEKTAPPAGKNASVESRVAFLESTLQRVCTQLEKSFPGCMSNKEVTDAPSKTDTATTKESGQGTGEAGKEASKEKT